MNPSARRTRCLTVASASVGLVLLVSTVFAAGPATASSHRWTADVGDVPVVVSAQYADLAVPTDTNLLTISLPDEFDWAPADLNDPAPTVVWSITRAGSVVGASEDPPAPDTGMLDGFGTTGSIDFSTLPTEPAVGTGYELNVHAVWSPFAPDNASDVVDLSIGFDVTADADDGDVPVDLTFANATSETRRYDVSLDGPLSGGDTLHVSTALVERPWDWTTGPDTGSRWDSKAQVYGGIGIGATDPLNPTQPLDGPFSVSTPDPTILVVPLPDVVYASATTIALRVSSRDAPPSGPVVTAVVNLTTGFTGSASNLVATTRPAISGEPVFGRSLHASGGSWAPASAGNWAQGSVTRSYQWYRGSTAIAGATSADHTVSVADVGQLLTVRVSAASPGYLRTVITTAAVSARAAAAPTATNRATVSGKFRVGRTVTAHTGSWTLAPTTYRFQWLRNGKVIKGATGTTLRLRAAHRGHDISCRITATVAGHSPGLSVSTAHHVK